MPDEDEVLNTDEICGQMFLNEDGELASCVLHRHPPQTGHCDGIDRPAADDELELMYEDAPDAGGSWVYLG